ncbi:MAG: class I SAM-dependent methyltransferase [Dehalococcoidia bacterium]|nr:Ubiquinone/menaquinone biosynthesis C-methyltransferase UbiE [Chloroflexota bacterium]
MNSRHKEFFDSMAEKWDEMVRHDPNKLRRIFDYIDLEAGQRVLDVGTGTGVLIPYIRDAIGTEGAVVAVDFSGEMLRIAQQKHTWENVKYLQGDVEKLKLDNEYDCIICYSVFPHFTNQEKIVQHLASGLKKSGKLVICHSQSREAVNSLHQRAGEEVRECQLPTIDQLRRMMEKVGLLVEKQIDGEEMFFIAAVKENLA